MKPYIKNRLWLIFAAIILIFIYKTDFSMQLGRLYAVLSPVIIAVLFAWFLIPLKVRTEKLLLRSKKFLVKKYSNLISAFLVYLCFVGAIIFFIVCLIPIIQDGIVNASEQLGNYRHIIEKYAGNDVVNRILQKVNPEIYINGAKNTIAFVVNIVMAIVILVYILLEHKKLKKLFVDSMSFIFGDEKTEKAIYYISKTNMIFSGYFYSKFISSVMLGILVSLGFFITGISYPLFFGVLVALFNMLPVFGSIISTVPVALLTFAEYGIAKAVVSVVIIIAGQQVENNILTPKIVGDTVGLSGFWIIVTTLVGGGLFGFWGLLICVPVSATLKMLFSEIKLRKSQT